MTQERLIRLVAMAAALGLPATAAIAQAATQQRAVRAPVARISDYSWIDRADALWEAIGDAPPDYSFPYQGLEPWAWQTADGHQIVVEDAGERGGIRSYYFAPGARSPFLVVEPGASFGFTGTRVVVIYGPDGGVVPRERWGQRPARGQVLFARARLIKQAMEREQRGIDPYAWSDASEPLLAFLDQWYLGRTRYSGWRTHRGSVEGMDRRRRLERERDRRRGAAGEFYRWRSGNSQGAPTAPHWRQPGGRPGYGPQQPGRPDAGTGTMRTRPRGEWRYPRPQDREPGRFDPALIEPVVPGSAPGRQGGDRPGRPGRPSLDDRVPVQAPATPAADDRPSRPHRPAPDAQPPASSEPLPPTGDRPARPPRPPRDVPAAAPAPEPQPAPPVERAESPSPVAAPVRLDRPDRGEGRPPRVPPTPQPAEMRPEPVAPTPQAPEVRFVEPQPAPVAEPQPEAPAQWQRPTERDRGEGAGPPAWKVEAPIQPGDVPEAETPAPVRTPPPPPSPTPPPPPAPSPPPPPAERAPETSSETPS